MQDANRRQPDNSDQELKKRESEATSTETVADLNEAESDTRSIQADQDPGPSPDGALDESDEIKDAGPM
jgi:hypothetical protein